MANSELRKERPEANGRVRANGEMASGEWEVHPLFATPYSPFAPDRAYAFGNSMMPGKNR
jgi:hypothetical protein